MQPGLWFTEKSSRGCQVFTFDASHAFVSFHLVTEMPNSMMCVLKSSTSSYLKGNSWFYTLIPENLSIGNLLKSIPIAFNFSSSFPANYSWRCFDQILSMVLFVSKEIRPQNDYNE